MGASAWAFWDVAKHKIANNEINLSGDDFRLALYMTAASATIATSTITIQSEIATNTEVSGGAYVAGGKLLVSPTWVESGGSVKFDCTNPIFTASASNIVNVRYGVILKSVAATSGKLLVWSALSTVQFAVTTGNTLTVQMAATGIFTLA